MGLVCLVPLSFLFPKVYNRYCHMLNDLRPYILKGKVEEDFGAITMTVEWIGVLKPPTSVSRG